MAILDAFKKKTSAKKADAPKKEKEVKPESAAKEKKAAPAASVSVKTGGIDLSMVIRAPRITEKATMLAERGAYVFDVHQASTKAMVRQAVVAKYGVFPTRINMITIAKKRRQSRTTGQTHAVGGGRKAVVYLKKGEKIEFV